VAPEFAPSTLNCTLMVFVETLAMTETAPETVVPEAGAVIAIVGGVVEDKLPFFEPALVRPTHPLQSSDSIIKTKQ
jgi:hypothetical protein